MKIKLKTFWITLLLILMMTINLSAQGLSLSGYARNYTGVLLNDTNNFSILQNTFNLNLEHSQDNVAFKINPMIYQYANEDPIFGIREAYLDIFFDSMDFRIGKQQIIWGKADGVFITDIVSPKNLDEFLLPDFDEIRIGTTSLKADYYLGNSAFELVWIPAFTSTKLAEAPSIWARTPDFPQSVEVVNDYSQKAIEPSLENSEAFFKFSGVSSLIDYELMAGYAWDDDPTMYITPEFGFVNGGPALTKVTLAPQHNRLSILGASTSADIMGYVIRTEAAYYSGKDFSAINATSLPFDIKEKDYLHYLVGTDFSIGETKLSAQFIQEYILDYDEAIVQEEFSNMATFLATRSFINETLTLQLFTYYDIINEDALIRPTISYDLSDGFEIQGGANIFTAGINNDYTSYFGYFDDNDMVYLKLKYSF